MNTTVNTLNDLHQTIRNLIVDSYGIGNKEDTIATMATKTLVRTMRYKPHPDGPDIKADYRHTDNPLCTLLIQDECSGLEVKTKDGEWNLWVPTHPNSLMFNVGDPLMAWSNGRLHSMYHRVSVKRGNARHTIASFLFPVKDTIIKPDEVFIDEKHPMMFKEFNHTEYLKYCHPKDPNPESDELVWKFAGV
ncbi:Gibberellin 20 oxidase 2 [Euphorbia peplus]|nr:Gibberellin 20 oxidase 2 [Euphorbia peplus]